MEEEEKMRSRSGIGHGVKVQYLGGVDWLWDGILIGFDAPDTGGMLEEDDTEEEEFDEERTLPIDKGSV
ncbi:hypothetical protein E2C01_042816 [Portunus trituberculatus]|uniref:Uncharacterized protein n=1 Tax=Portunus trituberculatus TaxID=210409 RepID=A0A5B7FVT4_PORTR|nr:hypothetical protein [Portunus trituberculatus]